MLCMWHKILVSLEPVFAAAHSLHMLDLLTEYSAGFDPTASKDLAQGIAKARFDCYPNLASEVFFRCKYRIYQLQ